MQSRHEAAKAASVAGANVPTRSYQAINALSRLAHGSWNRAGGHSSPMELSIAPIALLLQLEAFASWNISNMRSVVI